jgi:hypothetical protein
VHATAEELRPGYRAGVEKRRLIESEALPREAELKAAGIEVTTPSSSAVTLLSKRFEARSQA